jgi:ADP-ribose pyrophosphatase YjhB (NUDIX family)
MIQLTKILKELSIGDPIEQLAGVLIKYKDEFLLLKRTDNDLWAMPGGHVQQNEMPIDGAIRELLEETGIVSTSKNLKLIARVLTKGYSIFSVYLYDIDSKIEPKKLNSEHSEWGYFTINDLPKPLMLGVKESIKRALGI